MPEPQVRERSWAPWQRVVDGVQLVLQVSRALALDACSRCGPQSSPQATVFTTGSPNRRQTTRTKPRILGAGLQGVGCKSKPEQLHADPAVPVGRLMDPSNLRLQPTTQVSRMQIPLRALELLSEPIYPPTYHLWYAPSKPTCETMHRIFVASRRLSRQNFMIIVGWPDDVNAAPGL